MNNAVGLRDELAEFSQTMERVLRDNDHKSGWKRMSYGQLLRRLKQEVGELERATKNDGDIEREAADVANFCMFIAEKNRNDRAQMIDDIEACDADD